jgi:predicted nuclease with RNAse H fold
VKAPESSTVIAGIDLGGKLNGHTAMAILHHHVELMSCQKGINADSWMRVLMDKFSVDLIGMDAPLSLPGVYRGLPGFHHFHFRQCDLETGAMSPMFLGGLTARALELKTAWQSKGIEVVECYPKLLAREWDLNALGYKKRLENIEPVLEQMIKKSVMHLPAAQSWHEVDALLAMLSAQRYANKEHVSFGAEQEGTIVA